MALSVKWATIRRIWIRTGLIGTVIFIMWSLVVYRAQGVAGAALKSDARVTVTRGDGHWSFTPPNPARAGLIGRPADGLAAVDEGFVHAERTIERGFLAELHRVRGELLLLQGNESSAEDSLRLALDVSRQQQARSLELRAATSLARLLQASGRFPGARAALEPICNWFAEGRDTADLIATRTLLSGIG